MALVVVLGSAVTLLCFGPAQSVGQMPKESTTDNKSATVVFEEVSSQLPILPLVDSTAVRQLPASLKSSEYSLDYARHSLVPAMGGSVAVGDFNGDGRKDLYVVIPGGSNRLLEHRTGGTFADITDQAKVAGTGCDLGAAFGDFDKSGHPSLFVAGLRGVTVYHNNGDGTFTDVTAKAGLKGKAGELASSVLLFDADNDGFLDVLVTIYTDLNAPPSKPSFTFPNDFAGANSRLYRNQHDGTFAEVTSRAGLDGNPGRTHMALAGDFDKNGRQDLLLLRDDKPPALFRNQGHGEFEDKTWDAGTEIWKYAYVEGQTADFNNDGKVDAVLWSTIGNEVLLNRGSGKFAQDESLPLIYAANRAFGFHGLTADFNGDGSNDLLTVDNKGAWHLLMYHAGKFEEEPFELKIKDGLTRGFAALAALRLGNAGKRGSNDLTLVGLTLRGEIKIFRRAESQEVHGLSDKPSSK